MAHNLASGAGSQTAEVDHGMVAAVVWTKKPERYHSQSYLRVLQKYELNQSPFVEYK